MKFISIVTVLSSMAVLLSDVSAVHLNTSSTPQPRTESSKWNHSTQTSYLTRKPWKSGVSTGMPLRERSLKPNVGPESRLPKPGEESREP